MFYNPIDEFFCWLSDQWVDFFLKLYYWPMFVAGVSDDIAAIFNPKTYSICKV